MTLKPLAQQVIVVFGASSGIGRATALAAAERGAAIVAAARGESGLRSLVDDIESRGGSATAITADAVSFQDVQRVAQRAIDVYGRLDSWVHTAAVSIWARFEDTSPQEFARVIETTLTGQAYGAMAALPHLRRQGRGALIHVSSGEGRRGLPYQSAYAAAKHGIKGFLDCLRLELEREHTAISVTEVMPASINTPFFAKARTRLGVRPQPVPPVYSPAVVATAILYAAEHPVREIFVGSGAAALAAAERVSPRLADAAVRVTAEGQRSKQPSGPGAPDNMFQSLEGFDRVDGEFSGRTRNWSAYTWLATHPSVSLALKAGILGLGITFASRAAKRAAQPQQSQQQPPPQFFSGARRWNP